MVSTIYGKRRFGEALGKSYSLSYRSSVLNSWQIVSGPPLGKCGISCGDTIQVLAILCSG